MPKMVTTPMNMNKEDYAMIKRDELVRTRPTQDAEARSCSPRFTFSAS
jgi:hypothetical protein